MNQDDSSVFHTEHDTSDTGTSSLNNSLSEEEFTIVESANPDRGSLKLTISCRRKSSDNEVDEYSSVMSDNILLPGHENVGNSVDKEYQVLSTYK